MRMIFKQRLLQRLLTLVVLMFCLTVLGRNANDRPVAGTKESPPSVEQTQSPTVTAQTQPGAPLVISSPRIISNDGQYAETGFELINVSNKPIRAYAIRQELDTGGKRSSTFSLSNLDLSNAPPLQVNHSTTNYDTTELSAGNDPHISFSVTYVEFSDGATWGPDSARFAERSAGQRAAATFISKRLMKNLIGGGPADVMRAIESGEANIEPPAARSDEWKEGFQHGLNSIAARLKRAQTKGGPNEVEFELRRLDKKFNGVN